MKDWVGNKKSVFTTLGASNHSNTERAEHDFYATDPIAIDALLTKENFNKMVWEISAGEGHLSKRLTEFKYRVHSTDIIQRDFHLDNVLDFLQITKAPISGDFDIITNPPYNKALEFIEHSLNLLHSGCKVAMLLKLTFLEGQRRRKFFDLLPPKKVYIFSKRLHIAKNGDLEIFEKSSAICYAWFVWEKGCTSETIIDWI